MVTAQHVVAAGKPMQTAPFALQREEDKLVGYLSFLKIGPKLLRFIPGGKARDLRNWLQVWLRARARVVIDTK